jgi:hypothetical protein
MPTPTCVRLLCEAYGLGRTCVRHSSKSLGRSNSLREPRRPSIQGSLFAGLLFATIAVSVGANLRAPVLPIGATLGLSMDDPTYRHWSIQRQIGVLATRYESQWNCGPSEPDLTGTTVSWAEHVSASLLVPEDLAWLAPGPGRLSDGRHAAAAVVVGFPFACLVGGVSASDTNPTATAHSAAVGALAAPQTPAPAPLPLPEFSPRGFRPVAFSVNTVTLAVVTHILRLVVPRIGASIRERVSARRRHAGLCPRCRYPHPSGNCPECGASVSSGSA